MNKKHVLTIAAILITTQAFSMENLVQKHGYLLEVGDCVSSASMGGGVVLTARKKAVNNVGTDTPAT